MDFSNLLARRAWAPIVFALVCGCGGDDDGTSSGATGTGGAAGSGTGTAGASGADGTTDGSGTGAGGASGSGGTGGSAGDDGGTGKGGGAGKGGSAGKGGGAGTAGGAGKAGAAGTSGDSGTVGDSGTADVSTPPRPDASSDVTTPPGDGSTDDLIRELVARIKPEEFTAKCTALEAMSQPNRKTKTPEYTAATEWVKGWLATDAPSLTVAFDDWSGSRNVEIKIAGNDPAAGMYIIGSHLDSVTVTAGMDDDGSGSLGTAILASAMSHYLYKSEIRLLLFDGEEAGFVGSTHYAQALLAGGCQPDTCLKLYINMDMIGYDPQNTGGIRVNFDATTPKMVAEQVKGYVSGLTTRPGTGNCHSSDDCGFSRQGYAAGELLEPVFNPQWHKVGDTCDIMNPETANKAIQLAAAMLATMGGIYGRAP